MVRDLLTKLDTLTTSNVQKGSLKQPLAFNIAPQHDEVVSSTPLSCNMFNVLSSTSDTDDSTAVEESSDFIAPNQEAWRKAQNRRQRKSQELTRTGVAINHFKHGTVRLYHTIYSRINRLTLYLIVLIYSMIRMNWYYGQKLGNGL